MQTPTADGGPETSGPVLPPSEARAAVAPQATAGPPRVAAHYRSDQERARSVYRRANPWYRRLARGLIALSLIALCGVGLYAGARALQGYLDRDDLPEAGAEVPPIRRTSYEIRSAAPAPTVDGTITLDLATGAHDFLGRSNGTQAGVQVISPTPGEVYVRTGGEPWQVGTPADPNAAALASMVPLLAADSFDDVITEQIRDGYVDLIEHENEGVGADRITRYLLSVDSEALAEDHPDAWRSLRSDVMPTLVESDDTEITLWIDDANVLVRLRDERTGWTWERLAYDDQPFEPAHPLGAPAG